MLSFSLGPFALALNHLLVLLGLGLATLVGWYSARRRQGDNPEASLFYLFIIGLVCARGAFVLRYWAQYREDPLQILDIRDGGFLPWPGVIAALLVAAVLAWRQPRRRWPLLWGMGGGLLFWWMSSLASLLYSQDAQLPDVAISNAAGEPVSLRGYGGQPMVINLWATWCPPCRREMPVLIDAQQRYPNVRFVFVNQGETPQIVSGFIGASGLEMGQVLFDHQGTLARSIGSVALPTTLFYNADGRLVGHHLGELSAASLKHALEVFPAQ